MMRHRCVKLAFILAKGSYSLSHKCNSDMYHALGARLARPREGQRLNISRTLAAAACITAFIPVSVAARQQEGQLTNGDRPALFSALLDCRALADPQKRLACYDDRVGALDTAEKKRDVVIVDRKQVTEAKKSLFGLSLPTLHIFNNATGGDKDDDDVQEINTTIQQASQGGGHWLLVLADGARWQQTDDNYLDPPKPGTPIRIHRGALGSYMANVGKAPGIRVRRVN
jgi:hypothetical protein